MTYKTTVTADTTLSENVSSEVEIEIVDGQIIDLIFSNDSLDCDDKFAFAYFALDKLGLSVENSPSEFIS